MEIKIGFPYKSYDVKCKDRWYPLEKTPDKWGQIKVLYKTFHGRYRRERIVKLRLSYFGSSNYDFTPLIPSFIEIYDCKLTRKIYPDAKRAENNKLILELI